MSGVCRACPSLPGRASDLPGRFTVQKIGQQTCYNTDTVKSAGRSGAVREVWIMKGYYTQQGFFGLVDGVYILFSDESDYWEFMEEQAA